MPPAVSVSLFGLLISVSAVAAPPRQDVDLSATTLARNAHIADSSRCDSIPPIGWRVDTLFGSVTIEPADALPDGWDEMLLGAIGEYLHIPQAEGLPVGSATSDPIGMAGTVSPVIAGQAIASLDRVGVLGSPQISASTFSTEVDRSLLAAMRDLASAGTIPPFPRRVKAKAVRIRFTVEEDPDSIERRHAKPLSLLRNPMWRLERPVSEMPGNPKPRYPEAAELVGAEDEVLVSFIVDAEGKARLETARVLKGHYREFQLAVLKHLPRLRFHAARVEGCPVAQLVGKPFAFRTRS